MCHLQPTWQAVLVREGNEPDIFWTALGGKAEYPREKKVKEYTEDPRLFLISSSNGEQGFCSQFSLWVNNIILLYWLLSRFEVL